jgi:type III restriction enzyme
MLTRTPDAAASSAFFIPTTGHKNVCSVLRNFPLPNLLEVMESLMENTTPPMRISRRTLLEIFGTRDA